MIRIRYNLLITLGLLLFLGSCGKSRKDKKILNSVDLSVSVLRFDRDLFTVDVDNIEDGILMLEESYNPFFNLFTQGVIGIGLPEDDGFAEYLESFVTSQMVNEAYDEVQVVFPHTDELDRELTNAFKRYKYHFPNAHVPDVYGFVSGFNNSVILADSILGVGFDRYLGRDCRFYPMLGIHKYLQYNMHPQKIASDLILTWGMGEFPYNDTIDNLLNRLVYEGRLIYFAKQLLPKQPDSLILGFTPQQVKWCKSNERDMWGYFVEHKMLFSSDAFLINQYVKDAPFTASFKQDSPGRAAVWLGYRIVSEFMRRNQDYTLQMLMEETDYRSIMNRAKYKP